MIQKLVIKNTFFDVIDVDEDAPQRSQSAPPRLFGAGRAPARSLSRSARRAAAKAKRQMRLREDDVTLEEFSMKARVERWSFLAAKLMGAAVRARLASARPSLLAASHEQQTMQLELPRRLFIELACLVFENESDVMFLVRLGVLRIALGGEAIQIWSAPASLNHVVMRSLLGTGRGLASMANDGVFQVSGSGGRPIVLRHTAKFRVEDLRVFLLVQGFAPARLVHLRRPLADGFLSDYGVGPGSCILIETQVVQI